MKYYSALKRNTLSTHENRKKSHVLYLLMKEANLKRLHMYDSIYITEAKL